MFVWGGTAVAKKAKNAKTAGRCARLLAVLMGLQAGLPVLDFTGVRGQERTRYIAAVHAVLDRNYEPMTGVFRRIIARTEAAQARA